MKINKSLVLKADGGATYSVPVRDASYDCRHCFQLGNGRTMPPPTTINTYIHTSSSVTTRRRRWPYAISPRSSWAMRYTVTIIINDTYIYIMLFCIVSRPCLQRHGDNKIKSERRPKARQRSLCRTICRVRDTRDFSGYRRRVFERQTMSIIFRRRFYRKLGAADNVWNLVSAAAVMAIGEWRRRRRRRRSW